MVESLATEERFHLLVDSIEDYAIFILDPGGVVRSWNAGAQHCTGFAAAEIVGRHLSVFYREPNRSEHELAVAAREGRLEDEGWLLRKDGTQFWANVVITALRDPAGQLIGYGNVTRDLTERKRAEDHRRSFEERFRHLIESVKDYAIFILDPQGNVATWNAGAERIKGYRAEEIIGSHFSRFYPEEDVRAGKCEIELEGATRDGRYEDEGWRVRKDGSQFWANVVISAIRDDNGHLVGFSKVTRDLTERKRNEEERAARLAAEQASRMKDQFLAMLGHELRNPLAPIVSALQLLKLRGDAKSQREFQVIERQTKQLIRLVDDLLDVSRVARGTVELKRAPFDIREAIAKAAEIAIPLIEKKTQHFEVKTPSRPLIVDGDPSRLIQVFGNLMTNAAKYTDPGGHIFVMLRQYDREIVVEVRDDGVGIAPELLPNVFDLFVQGHQDSDRAEGGIGLGLSLVRSFVGLHGGTVEARSGGPRMGSSFIVRLPAVDPAIGLVADEAIETSITTNPANRRVLIVDDNEDALILLADILRSLGHDVRTASDGPEALRVIETWHPQVAVLDIGLPGMDGFELASRIRGSGEPIRLIALTGYGQPGDEARSKRAGFNAHLVKPVDVDRLLEQLTPGAA